MISEQQPRNSYIEYWPIGLEEIFLAVPRDHPLNQLSLPDKSIDLALTKDEPYIMHWENDKISALQEELFRSARFDPLCRYTASGMDLILSFVNKDLGLALISELVTGDYRPENMPCYYRIRSINTSRVVALGYRRGRTPTPGMQKLLEVAKEEFSLQKQRVKI